MQDVDIVVIGAGAAGLAAARRLAAAPVTSLVLEARHRIGGRAWTQHDASGVPLDIGCGWLHSADENEWATIAAKLSFVLDRTPPTWRRQAGDLGFSRREQDMFRAALAQFYGRLDAQAEAEPDRPAADLLEPDGRWNRLIDAISSYANGVELDRLSVRDFGRYRDTGTNWRVAAGYGALMQAYGAGLPVALDCPASLLDHSGALLRIETPRGDLRARAAIVTLPSAVIAGEGLRFKPALPDKLAAAAALPLGLANKLFLRLDGESDLPRDGHLYGATDRTATGSYYLRPLGHPMVEGFFGGRLARDLEQEGAAAFEAFAIDELAGLLGSGIRSALRRIAVSAWATDPFAGGSYSYAMVGHADARAALAAPVDGRLWFAGEACSLNDFSTAHGAYRTGLAAAEQALAALHAPAP